MFENGRLKVEPRTFKDDSALTREEFAESKKAWDAEHYADLNSATFYRVDLGEDRKQPKSTVRANSAWVMSEGFSRHKFLEEVISIQDKLSKKYLLGAVASIPLGLGMGQLGIVATNYLAGTALLAGSGFAAIPAAVGMLSGLACFPAAWAFLKSFDRSMGHLDGAKKELGELKEKMYG